MLVIINRQVFDSLDDISLIWTCIEPTIKQIRGRSFMIKSEFSSHLNSGQRALLMFQMLYGHTTNGVIEFYSHLSYLLSEKGVWLELKKGMEYFGDRSMVNFIDEMEDAYHIVEKTYRKEGTEWFYSINIDEDSEIKMMTDKLNKFLSGLLPDVIKSIALYIRNNPGEFVQLED